MFIRIAEKLHGRLSYWSRCWACNTSCSPYGRRKARPLRTFTTCLLPYLYPYRWENMFAWNHYIIPFNSWQNRIYLYHNHTDTHTSLTRISEITKILLSSKRVILKYNSCFSKTDNSRSVRAKDLVALLVYIVRISVAQNKRIVEKLWIFEVVFMLKNYVWIG